MSLDIHGTYQANHPFTLQFTRPIGWWASCAHGLQRIVRPLQYRSPVAESDSVPSSATPAGSVQPGGTITPLASSETSPRRTPAPAQVRPFVSMGNLVFDLFDSSGRHVSDMRRTLLAMRPLASLSVSPVVCIDHSIFRLEVGYVPRDYDDPRDFLSPSNLVQSALLRGCFQVGFSTVLNGLITMSFSSTVQILKVNQPESGISKKTGQPWERHTAECMLLDDAGAIECVGRLVIPQAMREGLAVGTYRASFALVVPTFGDQKGDITARLTGLIPVTVARTAPTAPAKAAQ